MTYDTWKETRRWIGLDPPDGSGALRITPLKINMEPKTSPNWKENYFSKFLGSMLIFRGVYTVRIIWYVLLAAVWVDPFLTDENRGPEIPSEEEEEAGAE